ncbi:hypothetical protein [Novosphingobium sp. FSW06-99]|uniref:hypothetical protein n=1 Tax=Novosphingobium sp. FSW06-99 TaxID=1739113 RepID=UPI00076D4E43|nr:hypothetical protein [Novosphingobium sp. FSW06-99]KUR76896.1 hypothetical protein AQZ49_11295 [Novosphingobium sp. FSW06-99]
MSEDSFFLECDRISQAVDAVQYERMRWAKTEGPMLARLVELAQAAIAERSEFEWTEEGATSDIKRFVLKVHSNRVAGLVLWLDQGHAMATIEEIGRSRYGVTPGDPIRADFALVDEAWMAATLQALFARIRF